MSKKVRSVKADQLKEFLVKRIKNLDSDQITMDNIAFQPLLIRNAVGFSVFTEFRSNMDEVLFSLKINEEVCRWDSKNFLIEYPLSDELIRDRGFWERIVTDYREEGLFVNSVFPEDEKGKKINRSHVRKALASHFAEEKEYYDRRGPVGYASSYRKYKKVFKPKLTDITIHTTQPMYSMETIVTFHLGNRPTPYSFSFQGDHPNYNEIEWDFLHDNFCLICSKLVDRVNKCRNCEKIGCRECLEEITLYRTTKWVCISTCVTQYRDDLRRMSINERMAEEGCVSYRNNVIFLSFLSGLGLSGIWWIFWGITGPILSFPFIGAGFGLIISTVIIRNDRKTIQDKMAKEILPLKRTLPTDSVSLRVTDLNTKWGEPITEIEAEEQTEIRDTYSDQPVDRIKTEITFFAKDAAKICSICRKPVSVPEELTYCPECTRPFHKRHLAETVKMTGKCPVCRAKLGMVID